MALSGTGATDITPPETTAALDQPPNSAGWHTSDVTVTLSAADEPWGSGLKTLTYSSAGAQAAASTVVTGASVQVPVNAEGSTTISFFATDNAGNVEARKIVVVNIDKTSPQTSCGGSDGTWHGGDVVIACVASDSGSGLVNPGDARFSLSTSVPAGTETASASTGSHTVCDVAGRCTTAGPVAGHTSTRRGRPSPSPVRRKLSMC